MTDLRKDLETRVTRLAAEQQTLTQTLERLNALCPPDPGAPSVTIPLGTPMGEVERRIVVATLAWTNFNKSATADALGISRRSIYNKLAELGGPERCTRCDAAPGDAAWPLPNLCPSCHGRTEAELKAAARQKAALLSDAGAAAVLRRAARGEDLVALADEYNVPRGVVRRLVRGVSYRHIPRPAELAVQVPRATLAGEVTA